MTPKKWYWESENRYYLILAYTDLFGNLVITKQWGGLNNNRGNSKTELVCDNEKLERVIADVSVRRKKRNYTLINS